MKQLLCGFVFVSFSCLAQDNVLKTDAGGIAGPELFAEYCAVCHGEQLEGAAQGVALINRDLTQGDSIEALEAVINAGVPNTGMLAWQKTLDSGKVRSLALLIKEYRSGLVTVDLKTDFSIPSGPQDSMHHGLSVVEVTDGLDRFPYSISVLPDDSIVVTEKMHGLRRVSPAGEVSNLIKGTPDTHNDVYVMESDGIEFGSGWLLDIEAHPNYSDNGWLYLHYTERCRDCGDVMDENNPPTSRNMVVRGRIKNGVWQDEELIWSAQEFDSNLYLDVVAGGRLAFDPEGYLFMTVGMRNMDTIQDLGTPYGKTHRVHDDGRVPNDNPFYNDDGVVKTIWTYGHRSPQGLTFSVDRREVWGTEHGPRGGDEINLLAPGGNYGWPLFSGGQNYDGTEVAHGRERSEVELQDTQLPVVEFTPSIAISNLVAYEGDAFPDWQGDFLVGSLKAQDLYRIRLRNGVVVEQEALLEDLGRIRDIDVGESGEVYLLIEHQGGGRIVKLVPLQAESVSTGE